MALTEDFPEIFDISKMPPILYHYTTVPGLFGIVEKQAIWATDFRFLNDGSEIFHTFEHFPNAEKVIKNLRDAYENLIGHPNYSIVSFSESSDDLAMWGRYSNDSGLCLGFKREDIEKLVVKEDHLQGSVIGKCLYDQIKKNEVITQIMKKYDPANKADLLYALLFIAPFLKNETFQHEREWRVVFKYNKEAIDKYGKPVFRSTQNVIIPYMHASILDKDSNNFKLSHIEKIILSPKLGRTPNAEMMIRNFLECYDIRLNILSKSKSSIV